MKAPLRGSRWSSKLFAELRWSACSSMEEVKLLVFSREVPDISDDSFTMAEDGGMVVGEIIGGLCITSMDVFVTEDGLYSPP